MNRQQRRKLEREKKKKEHHNIDETDIDEYFEGEVSMDIPNILYEWHQHDFTDLELNPFELILLLWKDTSSIHHNQLFTLYKENNLTITEIQVFLGRFFIDPSGKPMSNRTLAKVKDYININVVSMVDNKSYHETRDKLAGMIPNTERGPETFKYTPADIIAKVLFLPVTEINNAIKRINDLSLEWKWYNLMKDHAANKVGHSAGRIER